MLKLISKQIRPRSILPMTWNIRFFSDETKRNESSMLRQVRTNMQQDKQALSWRKTNKMAGDIDVKLNLINNEEQTSDFLIMMQRPFELSPKKWLEDWKKKQEKKERYLQQFMPERHQMLGPDLATAHFVLFRGGSVKFLDRPEWIKADEKNENKLPKSYEPGYKLEAIKCDNMVLYYEGLENIKWLQYLKFLSFHNVEHFDDWCLDRVSGSQCNALEVLDISGTKVTVNGLSCLYRLSSLKLLIVSDPKETLEHELAYAMLGESLPNLKIVSGASIHE